MPHHLFVTQMYIGLLQRAPDAEGLDFWTSALADGYWTQAQLQHNWLYEQPEALQLYSQHDTNHLFVEQLYLGILGREPDQGGGAYWTEQLASGAQTRQELPLTFFNAVRQQQGTQDAMLIAERIKTAQHFAEAGLNDRELARDVVQSTFADERTPHIARHLIDLVKTQTELAKEAREVLEKVRTLALNDDAASLHKIAENVESIAQSTTPVDGASLLKALPAEASPIPMPAPRPTPTPTPDPDPKPGGDSDGDDSDGDDAGGSDEDSGHTAPEPLDQVLPWRLLMSGVDYDGFHRIFVSDGTLEGTGFVPETEFYSYFSGFNRILVNEEQSNALIVHAEGYHGGSSSGVHTDITLYSSDGTASGTFVLADGLTAADSIDSPFQFDAGWAFLGADAYGVDSAKGAITDGTPSGTFQAVVEAPISEVLAIDSERGVLWHVGETVPGGRELYRIARDGDSWHQQQVKDIAPGTESGLAHWSNLYSLADASVLLPDGQLVFLATPESPYDKVPYISDGTASGTRPLLDLPEDITMFFVDQPLFEYQGNAAFLAYVERTPEAEGHGSRTGLELIISDGTPVGAQHLSLPDPLYYEATILGVNGDRIYIQSRRWNEETDSDDIVILESTGGAPTLLATAPTDLLDLELLGISDSTIFFKGRDVAHGDELWTLDQVSGELALTKDILPGSNAALAGYNQSFTIHNDQAIFTAYTSHTGVSVVVSDGTAAGTHVVGPGRPETQLLFDDLLAYNAAQGVFLVDLADEAPTAIRLADGVEDYPIYQQLQADSDQLYFTTAAGELQSRHLYSDSTVTLMENVVGFRVVGENGVFAIVDDDHSTPLWFSDGTMEGSTFVVDLADYNHIGYSNYWVDSIQQAAGLYNLL